MAKEKHIRDISKYYQSFSGTDTIAFLLFPGCAPIVLGSLTTISYSMYRNKKPVINIGRISINGVTRGTRIYAGTMIFTLINQHWLKELQDLTDPEIWIKPYKELKVDELPLFDIMITSANEYGNYVSMFIYGIDVTDEAQTVSVEDLFTENTFSFIARDISNFKKGRIFNKFAESSDVMEFDLGKSTDRILVSDTSIGSLDDLDKAANEMKQAHINAKKEWENSQKYRNYFHRNLEEKSGEPLIGNDVAAVQEMLNKLLGDRIMVTGVFNHQTAEAVREYQRRLKKRPTGIVDLDLYVTMINDTNKTKPTGYVINKDGAYVYKRPSLTSPILDTEPYRETTPIVEMIRSDDEYDVLFYKTTNGYVLVDDVYSSIYAREGYEKNTSEFPDVELEDRGTYVTMIQSMLAKIYPNFTLIDGKFGSSTKEFIKRFQKQNGLQETGTVDRQTWLSLISESGKDDKYKDKYNVTFNNNPPGTYTVKRSDLFEASNKYNAHITSDELFNVKSAIIVTFEDGTKETYDYVDSGYDKILSFEDMYGSFNDIELKKGKKAKRVDWIIYPYQQKPYKWKIKIER